MSSNKALTHELIPVEIMEPQAAQQPVDGENKPSTPLIVTINVNTLTVESPTRRTHGPGVMSRLGHMLRSAWMPWYPFALLGRRQWAAYRKTTTRYPRLMKAVCGIAAMTCTAASLWRQAMLPVSAGGGFLAFLLISLRTGLLPEVLAALEEAGGMPPPLTVLRHASHVIPQHMAAELRTIFRALNAARNAQHRQLALRIRLRAPRDEAPECATDSGKEWTVS